MHTPLPSSQDWEQLSLMVPEVLEVVLRVGLVQSTCHAQLQLEITNPSTGELMGLVARPHVDFSDLDDAMLVLWQEFSEFIRSRSGPFV